VSASEKLRALDAAIAPVGDEYWPPDGEVWMAGGNLEAVAALRNALPLIADVIEAAEEDLAALEVRMRGTNYKFIHETERLTAALTALQEHLGEVS